MEKIKKVRPFKGCDPVYVEFIHNSRLISDDISYSVVRSADEPCIPDNVLMVTSVRSLAFSYLKQLRDVNYDKSYAIIITRKTRNVCF